MPPRACGSLIESTQSGFRVAVGRRRLEPGAAERRHGRLNNLADTSETARDPGCPRPAQVPSGSLYSSALRGEADLDPQRAARSRGPARGHPHCGAQDRSRRRLAGEAGSRKSPAEGTGGGRHVEALRTLEEAAHAACVAEAGSSLPRARGRGKNFRPGDGSDAAARDAGRAVRRALTRCESPPTGGKVEFWYPPTGHAPQPLAKVASAASCRACPPASRP